MQTPLAIVIIITVYFFLKLLNWRNSGKIDFKGYRIDCFMDIIYIGFNIIFVITAQKLGGLDIDIWGYLLFLLAIIFPAIFFYIKKKIFIRLGFKINGWYPLNDIIIFGLSTFGLSFLYEILKCFNSMC